ncbi:MAG: (2Fe-2S)-binding protein [Myxococcales bacterium]|nr:(2Fe-2S)-binding protein [Myxococcales bacterium]
MAVIETNRDEPQGPKPLSVAFVRDAWYVASIGTELKSKILSTRLFGQPIVLFRGADNRPVALLDRCPHRNAPLSEGKLVEGQLQCGYHGWRFDSQGACVHVPGLCSEDYRRNQNATRFATYEQDGFIWIYGNPSVADPAPPESIACCDAKNYMTRRATYDVEATLHAVAENILDVPHTAYLHGGLFRKQGGETPIDVVVRRMADRVEAEFIGEKRPAGIVGRILAPGSGDVIHVDRFILPSWAQVEYQLGESYHMMGTNLLTPLDARTTRVFACFSLKSRIPAWLLWPFFRIVAKRIIKQDIRILKLQSETIELFGGEQFTSTEVDVLGLQIWQLLKQAQRGETQVSREPSERRFQMLV